MKTMTSRERIQRMYEHREADRIPITDHPWGATLDRWRREGIPSSVSLEDFTQIVALAKKLGAY